MTSRLGLLALASLAACSGAAPPPAALAKAAPAPHADHAGAFVDMVSPARLLPDLVGDRGVVAREDGYRRILVDRMRILAHEDGSIERAAEFLPLGVVASVALPSRLGGGFLFHANTGGGTLMWRASAWLAKLTPLIQLSSSVAEIIPGFDRLYLRFQSGGRLAAIDADSGEERSTAPLPPASAYGRLAFADGWRAVVDTDLRGPLATFDAGSTWRPVPLAERPLSIDVVDGDPAIAVQGGRYLINARGAVTFRAESKEPGPSPGAPQDDAEPAARAAGPLGKKPLRAAVEDGWPDSPTTAVVARGGALARVSLLDGAILALADEAYPERLASCHAIRVGQRAEASTGIGFLCGERDGATAVYELAPPLALKPVLRFARPRFVAASGNGALVVRGGCTDAPAADDGARPYCIRNPRGELREIRVKGDLGVERVVALADGRVAVLVPPRGGSAGQLTLLDGAAATSVALKLPEVPRSVARELRRGMWLDGVEEREKGVLGAWIESGGPLIGIRIALDGRVTAGDLRDDAGGAIVAGRFGLSLGEGGRAVETTDGGLHWEVVDLPSRDEDLVHAGATRACGPAGCALGGWIRVGWGKPAEGEGDLQPADPPPQSFRRLVSSPPLGFACELGASSTPPAAAAMRPAPLRRGAVLGVMGRRLGVTPAPQGPATPNGWLAFRNTPGPVLGNDEIGYDGGPAADTVMLHAYAWGKRGADWTRAGRWLVRFDDRFDAAGGVRSSALTTSLWPDEAAAAEAVNSGSYGAVAWSGFLDPSGHAVLADACRSSVCAMYAVGDGQPVLPVRDAAGHSAVFPGPLAGGAVRVGDAWYFLGKGSAAEAVALWRVDLGVARQIGTYWRSARFVPDTPRLVRRALGAGVGLLLVSAPGPGEPTGSWYVLPVNPDTGELGEASLLVRRDLAGATLERCGVGRDGWLVETSLTPAPSVEVQGSYGGFDALEMRARIDPGSVCVEGISARVVGLSTKPRAGGKPAPAAPKTAALADDPAAFPMAATESGTLRRWALTCRSRQPHWRP